MSDRLPSELLDELFGIGAIQIEREGKYRFKRHEKERDAPLSPVYFNLRTAENPKPGPLTAKLVREISQALLGLARRETIVYDLVAGIPNAGDPFAEKFFELLRDSKVYVPLISFVKEETPQGRRIAGLKPGIVVPEHEHRLLLLDDVVEGAETKLEAIRCAEENGFEVVGILTLLRYDYSTADAAKRLKREGYVFHSVFRVSEVAKHCHETGRIDEEQYDAVMHFLASR